MTIEDRYEALKTRAIRVRSLAEGSKNSAQELKVQFEETTQNLADEKDSLNVQQFAIDCLKEIMDKMSQEHVERIVNLLTYALQTIFYDKDYSVEIVTSDKRNVKTAEISLVERQEDKVIRSSFDDIGGGVVAVCGLVLQVYYCNVLKQAPILFLDEQLSQVSENYVPTLMQFVKELASTKDLIMVLISHDNRYISYADKTYRVDDGQVKEEL